MAFKDVFRKQPNQAEREAYEFAGLVMEVGSIHAPYTRHPKTDEKPRNPT